MNRALFPSIIVGVILLGCTAGIAAAPGANYEHLKVLEPFLGSWDYEGPLHEDIPGFAKKGAKLRIAFRYHWILNKNAIPMDWSLQLDGGGALDGKVLIGFDNKGGKIVSGEFTSLGEYSHREWSVAGKTLTIRGHGITADGSEVSATVTNARGI